MFSHRHYYHIKPEKIILRSRNKDCRDKNEQVRKRHSDHTTREGQVQVHKSKYSDGKKNTLGLLHSSMGWDGKVLSTRRSLRHLINNFET